MKGLHWADSGSPAWGSYTGFLAPGDQALDRLLLARPMSLHRSEG